MPAFRDIRDPIHGFIRLEGRECDVLDTPIVQRLRRIRQLAMAHLVYPGAVHTRLEHTLGVVHVAGRICARLEIEPEATRVIRLAALLHDVGHGPFSHPSEEVLAELADAGGGKPKGETHKIHELITREIILTDPDLRSYISEKDREAIVQLLDTGWGLPVHKDVISGPLDADKQDYLLRDSHHCGVRYGIYDINRLQDVLCRVPDAPGDSLAVDEDGVHTLEQFVLARYYLTTQVISHKIRRISDAMLVRGLKLGATVDGLRFLRRLYQFRADPGFIQEYGQWNDERLVARLLEPQCSKTWAGRFMRRLADRRLLKIVFRQAVAEFPGLVLDGNRARKAAPAIEAEVAGVLGVAPEEVIFKVHRSPPTRKPEGAVLIARRHGSPEPFENRSLIFKPIAQSLQERYFECYAPVDGLDERLRRQAEEEIATAVRKRLTQLTPKPDRAKIKMSRKK